jgi:hypothetical protein
MRMIRIQGCVVTSLVICLAAVGASEAADPSSSEQIPLTWLTDYSEAMRSAEASDKMLLVFFRGKQPNGYRDQFLNQVATDKAIREQMSRYILLELPVDATIVSEGQQVNLVRHGAFAELSGREGLAIIDFVNRETDHYGHVVSVFPLQPGRYYRYQPQHLAVILDLPSGTLTQRTMIFAVRIHPEAPASTGGELCSILTEEATSASDYQARIHVQGHHRWGERFQRIAGRLFPWRLRGQEVVAESWPHEDVVDAAVDCVDCWRQSSGHWSAVRTYQPRFGYDMRRGSNGIWYATGLFGNNN